MKEKMNEKKKYNGVKAGIWYTVGNMLIKGIPFFTLPIFTRLLSTGDFGVYNTYIAYEGIICIILGFGFSGTVKTAYYDFKKIFDRYISSIISLIIGIGAIVIIFSNICCMFEITSEIFNSFIINCLIIQSVGSAIYGIISSKYIILGEYKKNLFAAMVMTIFNVLISLGLCYWGLENERAYARIIGTLVGVVVVTIIMIYKQYQQAPIAFSKAYITYGLKLGVPLVPHLLSMTLLAQCDKIMIQSIVGDSEAGIYSLAVNITMILTVVMTSIDSAWAPWFYGSLAEKKYKEIVGTNNIILVFFAFLTCGFLLIGPDLIYLMSSKVYWTSIYAFIPLTISIFINFMYLFDINLEYFNKKTGYISVSTILCAIMNILLNYVMIQIWGYIAAAYATCLAKMMLFLMHHFRAHKLEKNPVISNKYLVICLSSVVFIASLDYIFIDIIWMRYILIVIIVLIVMWFMYKYGVIKKYLDRYKEKNENV